MSSLVSAWRLTSARWAETAFDGEGARLNGGRWNRPGHPAVYVAGSRALAALEVLVHLDQWSSGIEFVRFEVSIPDQLVDRSWKVEWHNQRILHRDITAPNPQPCTQDFGDRWLRRSPMPALEVPSAMIPEESNYLLNPCHPGFKTLRIGTPEPFAFDRRLLEH